MLKQQVQQANLAIQNHLAMAANQPPTTIAQQQYQPPQQQQQLSHGQHRGKGGSGRGNTRYGCGGPFQLNNYGRKRNYNANGRYYVGGCSMPGSPGYIRQKQGGNQNQCNDFYTNMLAANLQNQMKQYNNWYYCWSHGFDVIK